MLERSIAYHISEYLLRMLHERFMARDPDGPIADFIRGWMEQPWYDMTDEEREAITQLSVDLYEEEENAGIRN